MDIAKFIRNLQNKPEPTKKLILWVSTGVITLIIGSGWIVSLQPGENIKMNSQAKQQNNNLGNIFRSFKKDMASLKNKIPPVNINKKTEDQTQKLEKTNKIKKDQTETKTRKDKRELYKLPLSN